MSARKTLTTLLAEQRALNTQVRSQVADLELLLQDAALDKQRLQEQIERAGVEVERAVMRCNAMEFALVLARQNALLMDDERRRLRKFATSDTVSVAR